VNQPLNLKCENLVSKAFAAFHKCNLYRYSLAMYVALSLLIGTVWLRIGNNADVVVDVVGVLFFVAAFMVFMSVSVLPAFLEEKAVFVRERANGGAVQVEFSLTHSSLKSPGFNPVEPMK
jgi:hypothetical protein